MKDGPIYDVQWNPMHNEFIVVHGCSLLVLHQNECFFTFILYLSSYESLFGFFFSNFEVCIEQSGFSLSLVFLFFFFFLFFLFVVDMPSKAVAYSSKAEPLFEFGTEARNTVRYNPQGNCLCLWIFIT